jgi:CubicO group peptidase (beta-lactamase class C family)
MKRRRFLGAVALAPLAGIGACGPAISRAESAGAAGLAPADSELRPADPVEAGLSRAKLDHAVALIEREVGEGSVQSVSILVARQGRVVLHRGFGRLGAGATPPTQPDSIYQVASITKPVTAAALMLLVEDGRVLLTERASTYLPEFVGDEREQVRVRDLLSHTSGLPDMLPENVELRRAHAPLEEFVRRAFSTPLLFSPGTSFQYQSMGILLAAVIVERAMGMSLNEFEQREIFGPLGMRHSVLGLAPFAIRDTVQIQSSAGANPQDLRHWGSNTEYWRNMAHPWGGMHTTTGDLAILFQTFLNGGSYAGRRVFGPATVRAMVSDQNQHLDAPWGLGWALAAFRGRTRFGDLVSSATFGHSGASGTVAWADPESGLTCIVLTSRPLAIDGGRFVQSVSNVVAAAVDG